MVELFSDQPIEDADTFARSLAGDSFNLLVAAQRLGTQTGYITRLGDDAFAGYLLNTWRGEGIDTTAVKTVPGFNAMHFVALLQGGEVASRVKSAADAVFAVMMIKGIEARQSARAQLG